MTGKRWNFSSSRGIACPSVGTIASLMIVASGLLALLLPSSALAAECTDTYTGPAEGLWLKSENWSAGHIPTAEDTVCIGPSKAVRVFGAEAHAGVLVAEGMVEVESGTLNIVNTLEASTIENLRLVGSGHLVGSATVDISGAFESEGSSTMAGSGTTVLLPGASGLANDGGSEMRLIEGRRLVNESVFTLSSGYLYLEEGAEIENLGTFTANSEETWFVHKTISGREGSSFVNKGAFRKASGTGSTSINLPFKNEGTVEAQSGSLDFYAGGSGTEGSEWAGTEGAVRFFEGTFNLNGGDLAGLIGVRGGEVVTNEVSAPTAHLELANGTLNVASEMTVASLESCCSAWIKGNGTLKVINTLIASDEFNLSGLGKLVLLPGGTGSRINGGTFQLRGSYSFINEGTFTVASGKIFLNEFSFIVNSGTFIANSEEVTFQKSIAGQENTTFVNTGTVKKTAGTGTTEITVPFENLGEKIKQESGQLIIVNPIDRKASEQFGKHCHSGDPVECATGNFTESQTDISVGGLGVGLNLTRDYSAQAAASAGSPGPFGYGWSATFSDHLVSSEEGKTITLFSAEGNTVPFKKSGESLNAPTWSQDTLSGNAETGYTLITPNQNEYVFTSAGKLESVTDRNGNETRLAYEGSGRLETITDPAGRKITLAYNGSGQVESAEDPMGHVVKYGYESGRLTSVTMPGETEPRWRFKYDGSNRITQITDGRGGKTTNEYDGSSRVISQTDPAGHKTTFEYTAFHTKITNEATGSVTDEWFTSNNEPVSVTRGFGTADATTETFSYNAAGLLLSRTDGNGHKTTYGYDAQGNRTSEKDAAGDETKWTYNETHDVVSMMTPEGEKTTITRDANGNPETVSRPAPDKETQTIAYEFGSNGELEALIDPLSHKWSYEYDSQGDRIAQVDPEGDKQTWEYDEDSRLMAAVSPRGNEEGAEAAKFTTSIERDPQGRPIKVTDPLEGTTEYEYDPNGNLEVETNPNGHSTHLTYNADNERTKVERPNGDVEETGYDGAGEVTSQTDGDKGKTTYVRNVLEEPVETIDPLERASTAEFDAAGNLKSKTDPEERTTSYAYDAADRLKEVSYSDGLTPTATFGYDKDGNLTSMKDGSGESSFEFDQLDRLTHSEDGNGDTVGYEYNLGEEQVGLTYPNGKSISREFDDAGRLESLTDWLGHTTTFSYNNDSALKATTFPSGTGNVDEYGYDRADQMSSVTMKRGAETLASISYTRDKAGQIEGLVSKGLPGAEEEKFSYDENERLTKAGSDSFEYDAANNLTEAPGTTNSYDKASQLEAATGASFSFDEEGERTAMTPSAGPATTYKYDQAGNLTAVERANEGETPAISEGLPTTGTASGHRRRSRARLAISPGIRRQASRYSSAMDTTVTSTDRPGSQSSRSPPEKCRPICTTTSWAVRGC